MTTSTRSDDARRLAVDGDDPCSCGRPAVYVFANDDFGDVSWCGLNA